MLWTRGESLATLVMGRTLVYIFFFYVDVLRLLQAPRLLEGGPEPCVSGGRVPVQGQDGLGGEVTLITPHTLLQCQGV